MCFLVETSQRRLSKLIIQINLPWTCSEEHPHVENKRCNMQHPTNDSFNPSVLPLYCRSTVWWWYFATQVLKAQSLSLADIIWAARGAHEPAVVHAALQPSIFIVSLPLQPLGLLHLPAQFQHQGFHNHFRRLTSWAPIVRLIPAEPRHARSFICRGHRPSAAFTFTCRGAVKVVLVAYNKV